MGLVNGENGALVPLIRSHRHASGKRDSANSPRNYTSQSWKIHLHEKDSFPLVL
jgi:hypothetical protein